MSDFCNISRNKICYIVLAFSIIFFLSSVCTFAVLAVTKENNTIPVNIENVEEGPSIEQSKILKRLKRIEERIKKRNNKRKRNK